MATQKIGLLPTSSEPGPHKIGPSRKKIGQQDDPKYIQVLEVTPTTYPTKNSDVMR